jgi:hypothetical protein
MAYAPPNFTPYVWQDGEPGGTALNAIGLNAAEQLTANGFKAGDISVAAYADTLLAGAATSTALAAEVARATAAEALLAPLSSPALTNTPTAPTPPAADNSTRLSTTAYSDRAAALAASGVVVPAASTTNPAADGAAAPGTATPYARADHVHPTDTTRAPLAKRITSIVSSATPAVNVGATDVVTITAQAVPITSMSSGLTGVPTIEQPIMWRIHATAALAITWGASFMSDGVVPLPGTTVANKTIRVGTVWDEVAAKHVCIAASVVGY